SAAAQHAQSSDTRVTVAGVQVAIDGHGRLRPPTAQEARRLAAGLAAMFAPQGHLESAEKSASGTMSFVFGAESLNVALVRLGNDGKPVQACVDSYADALQFLLGNAPALEEK